MSTNIPRKVPPQEKRKPPNGCYTGVLVLEESDLPMTPDEIIQAAENSDASRFLDGGVVFFIRFPGSDTVREQTEAALRTGGTLELNK